MYKILITMVSLLILNGCGGGSSSTTTTTPNVALKIGYLVDAPLEGVTYSCGSITGVTTATGAFQCSETPITFSIGSWVIGTLNTFTSDSVVYPQDLVGVPRSDYNSTALVELTQILQSLDDDGNVTDRITIRSDANTLFDQNATTGTYAAVQQILSNAHITIVDANTSINHLRDTINSTDTIAPTVTAPSNISVVGTSASGIDANDSQIVAFLAGATATDNVAVAGSVTHNAPSFFPVGDTIVTFTAVDDANNSGTASATVTVTAPPVVITDTTAPVVTAPANISVVGTSASGIDATDSQIVAFLAGATANDNVAVVGSVTNNAPSIFPVGDTIVTFTAVDAANNSGTASATVTVTAPSVVVTDTTAPVVTAPANISVVGTSASGIDATAIQIASFLSSATATDNVGLVGGVSNDAPTFFPVGSTLVTFSAIDAASNSGTATATVTVTAPTVTTAKTAFVPQAVTYPSVTPTVGVDLTGQIASLKTGIIVVIRSTIDDSNVSYTLPNPISFSPTATTYNIVLESGSINKTITVSVGADGVGNTADDTISSCILRINGWEIDYTSSGADATWFTSDDTIGLLIPLSSLNSETFSYTNASGYTMTISGQYGVGADELLSTADDFVSAYVVSKVGTSGSTGAATTFNGAGADGIWFTSDDAVREHSVSSVDVNGNTFQTITYSATGTDGLWYTADDTVLIYTSALLNAANKIDALGVYNSGSNGVAFDADDVLVNQTFFRYDANGYQDIVASYTSAGSDQTWFTADDTATAISYAHSSTGIVTEKTIHTAIGADLMWLTGDDTISRRTFYTNNGEVERVSYSAGTDALWFTADDVFNDVPVTYNIVKDANGNVVSLTQSTAYLDAQYNLNNDIISRVIVNKAGYGADGIPRTNDDVLTSGFVRTFDAQNRVTSFGILKTIGADGTWFTADDDYTTYIKYTYSVNGDLIRQSQSNNAGADGIWGTSDDTLSGLSIGTTDGQGRLVETVELLAGADGVFETADDTIGSLSKHIFNDVNRTRTNASYSAAGADGVWRTADDVFSGNAYYVETFDANGSVIQLTYYNQIGTDGVWLTADDVVQYYGTQRYDANGYLDRSIYYFSSGLDGVWFTADDGAATRAYSVDVFDNAGTLLQRTNYTGKGPDDILGNSNDPVGSIQLYYIPTYAL